MNWMPPKIWEDGRCFIIGGGPSMAHQFGIPDEVIAKVRLGEAPVSLFSPYLSPIHSEHVIGVNNAYMLGNWIDCCFFGDCGWYLVHRLKLAEWPNLKVTCCPRFEKKSKARSEGVKYLGKDSSHRLGITSRPNRVSWNSNSGAASINLAAHFGAKQIVLLGFDMSLNGGSSHWHKGHGGPKVPPFLRHLRGFPVIAEDAQKLGIEIINASPNSAIKEFPKVKLSEVI